MKLDDEKRIAAKLARVMAMLCVRNTQLETIHAGKIPITRTGDYSDVFVLDADDRRIPWTEVSRIDEDEMQGLMRDISSIACTRFIFAPMTPGNRRRSSAGCVSYQNGTSRKSIRG